MKFPVTFKNVSGMEIIVYTKEPYDRFFDNRNPREWKIVVDKKDD